MVEEKKVLSPEPIAVGIKEVTNTAELGVKEPLEDTTSEVSSKGYEVACESTVP